MAKKKKSKKRVSPEISKAQLKKMEKKANETLALFAKKALPILRAVLNRPPASPMTIETKLDVGDGRTIHFVLQAGTIRDAKGFRGQLKLVVIGEPGAKPAVSAKARSRAKKGRK